MSDEVAVDVTLWWDFFPKSFLLYFLCAGIPSQWGKFLLLYGGCCCCCRFRNSFLNGTHIARMIYDLSLVTFSMWRASVTERLAKDATEWANDRARKKNVSFDLFVNLSVIRLRWQISAMRWQFFFSLSLSIRCLALISHLTIPKRENEKSKLIDDGIAVWPTMNALKIAIVQRQRSF